MKKFVLLLLSMFLFSYCYSQPEKSFFLPESENFDTSLPFPGELSGHNFGFWHFSHDQLVHYLTQLTESLDRLSMWEYGRTHENRPLYLLAITSPENQEKLEQIRKENVESLNNSNEQNKEQSTLFIWLGYSVHGNEASPGNAAMLTAYYLSASKSPSIEAMLDSTVVLIDPCLNPDGFSRAANWSNMHIHENIVTDPADRQFREDWPGGRTNHYWFDLNRDWLPVQHPESKARVKAFHRWKPHVLTDHHEMGTNSTFFFQPGVPERVNPLTPEANFRITKEISKYHADALDNIGSLYFSEEGFDDFYYGKGSTYPDVNGTIGILFEQSRVLGQEIKTSRGKLSFAEAIKNHFTVSLSTLKASRDKRSELISYQRNFYDKSELLAGEDKVAGYIFGDKNDPVKLNHFLKLLKTHSISVYSLNRDLTVDGTDYEKGRAFIVPAKQNQYRLIKSLFEKRTTFEDSIFYDVSTWTMPLAFNLDYDVLRSDSKINRYAKQKIEDNFEPQDRITGGKSNVGYLAGGENYNIHAFLNELIDKELKVQVAAKSFSVAIDSEKYDFTNGSIFIPSENQPVAADSLYEYIKEVSEKFDVKIFGLETGLSEKGIDLGSWNFIPVKKPEILVVAGEGVSSRSAGEIWYLLDHKMNMQITVAKPDQLNRLNLFDYNTLILPDGNYTWGDKIKNKLEFWVNEGGLMIALEDANKWLNKNELISWELKQEEKSDTNSRKVYQYSNRRQRRRAKSMNGIILKSSIDITHPLGYGINNKYIPVFKGNSLFIKKSKDPYSTPLWIGENPLMSGYLHKETKALAENSAWCLVNRKGKGQVISFVDNPNFRGYWYGTEKVFLNAIFYGRFIR